MLTWFCKFFANYVRQSPYSIAAVLIVAIAGIFLYRSFLKEPEVLWGTLDHDRNAHYLAAIKPAIALRQFDLWQCCVDMLRVRTWPPLHAFLVGSFAGLFGTDYRVTVWPSLVVWSLGGVFAFALASALHRRHGVVSGAVALALYLSSPAHRAFATDFMLETLGSTLTLSTFYFYVVHRQGAKSTIIPLSISLSMLFFAKYNYWLLVVLALLATELWDRRRDLGKCYQRLQQFELRDWFVLQTRTVANYPILALLSVYVYKLTAKWSTVSLPGSESPSKNENLVHLLFLAVVVRMAACWKSEGARLWKQASPDLRVLGIWHVVPLILWFCLPKRLGYFLWYISPANGPNTVDRSWFVSAQYYWGQLSEYYVDAPWIAIFTICVAALPILFPRCRSRECWVLVAFVAIAIALTLNHPNQKSRFLHTWISCVWVLAGVGIATLIQFLNDRLGSSTQKWLALPSATLLVLGSLLTIDRGRSPESGHFRNVSSLPIAKTYLPWLEKDEPVAIFGTLPIEYFAEWTYLVAYPERQRPWTASNLRWFGTDAAINETRFNTWLTENSPQSIVLVDVLEGSPVGFPDCEHFRQYRELLNGQPEYVLQKSETLDRQRCEVSLWTRK